MRSFFLKLLIIIIPVSLIVAFINYKVDPANVFSGREYVDGIADILIQGHNVDNLSNYDERLLQEQMIKRLQKTPDVVVLGSSRIMEIGSSFFPGMTVLNAGVSHGNIHDLYGIVGLLDSLNRLPQAIVIGVDHGLLEQGGSAEWQSLYNYHEYLINKLFRDSSQQFNSQIPRPFRKLSSLISLDYFQSSLKFLLERKSKQYIDVATNKPTVYGRFSDGSICYANEYTHPDHSKVASDAKVTGSKTGFLSPDNSKIKLFKKLLEFLHDKNVTVHLVMIPYHPEFYKACLQSHPKIMDEWAPLFKDIAAKHQVSLSGTFDANSIKMPADVFYDMYHCSGESIKQFIPIR